MKVLIFAAGKGSRLGLGIPKALVEVGGKTLLERHVDSLIQLGIGLFDITVVTGFMSEEVTGKCRDMELNSLKNPLWNYAGTYSSFAVYPHSNDPLLVIHGDLIWEAGLAESIIRKQNSIVIPVDPRSREDEEAMKVEVRGNRVLHMSKKLPISRSAGESMGMFCLPDSLLVQKYSSHLIENPEASFDDAVNIAAGFVSVEAFITDKFDWEESDTPADLSRARSRFS